MDEFFGGIDGRFRVSITDSTMMWIVHHAMDKAHGKVKSKGGVVERLNEVSKFYELAVMQLEGCLKLVQEETDSCIHESNHDEVLADLSKIKDRLQGRLKESELAISEKDRELTERLENEVKLRQALEVKERELVMLRAANLELERTKSEGNEGFVLGSRGSGDEDRDVEFSELKNSVDQQVWNMKQKLGPDYQPIDEERNRGIDNKTIEQMGLDIDILKETLDLDFEKLQNAIFLSELGPMEQQWRWTIEKDTISILIKGLMKNFQESFEAKVRKQEKQVLIGLSEHWSDLIHKVTSLRSELERLCSENDVQVICVEARNASAPPSISECKISHGPVEKPSLEDTCYDKTGKSSLKGEEVDYMEELSKKEREENRSHSVAKMIKNHESIIRRKNEELNFLKREMLREKGYSSLKREKEHESLKRKIHDVLVRLDNLMEWNAKVGKNVGDHGAIHGEGSFLEDRESQFDDSIDSLADVWKKIDRVSVSYAVNEEQKSEIRMLKQEKEDANLRAMIIEDTYITLLKGWIKEFYIELHNYDLEGAVREDMWTVLLGEMFKEWNKSIESYDTKSLVREEICRVVFGESIRSIVSTARSALSQHQEDKLAEIFVKEDVCMLLCRETVKELKMDIQDYNLESLIREDIYQFVIVEAVNDALILLSEAEYPIQDNISEDMSTNYKLCNGVQVSGEENLIQKIDSLSECFEVEESELKEHTADLDLVSSKSEETDEEQKLIDEEHNFSSVSSKLQKSLQQLVVSKALISELEPSLVMAVDDFEKIHDVSFELSKENEEAQLDTFDSVFSPLLGFAQVLVDFERVIHEKLGMNILRLEEVKYNLDPVVEHVASLRNKEFLYQKAFIRRSQNLRKAELEVDLLGDQVDVLLGLLEKIHITLHRYAPALQQYFEVSDILKLIKKELYGGAVHTPNQKY